MRSKVVRGVVIRIPASRAASNFNTCFPLWGEWRATASRERSVKFSVFSRLPLGGRLLAEQGGEGCRYPHPGKQSGERMRSDSGLFQFSVFSQLPLGGRLLAKQGGEGCRYPHPGKQSGEQLQHLLSPLGRVASNREPREVCLKLIPPPPHVCKKYTFSNRLKCRKNTYNKLRRFFLCGNGFGTTRQQSLSP